MALDILVFARRPSFGLRFLEDSGNVQKGTTSLDKAVDYFKNRSLDEVYLEFDKKVFDLWSKFRDQVKIQQVVVENYLSEENEKIRTDATQVIILCPEKDGPKGYILKIKR